MRHEPNLGIEQYRHCPPGWASPEGVNWGAFRIPYKDSTLQVLSSGTDEEHGWEHVSVSLSSRCPTWEEMCHIKSLFWRDHEVVVQYHPSKYEYVNQHDFCLHLWRPLGVEIPTPPKILVGVGNDH